MSSDLFSVGPDAFLFLQRAFEQAMKTSCLKSRAGYLFCEVDNLDKIGSLPVFELGAAGRWFKVPASSLLSTCYARAFNPEQGYVCMFTLKHNAASQKIGLGLLYANDLAFAKVRNTIGSLASAGIAPKPEFSQPDWRAKLSLGHLEQARSEAADYWKQIYDAIQVVRVNVGFSPALSPLDFFQGMFTTTTTAF